jgi:hypothetical protein
MGVLIFSQFKLTLTILERFLAGLDLKYLRLDGDTLGQILVRLLCRHVPRLEFVVDEVWVTQRLAQLHEDVTAKEAHQNLTDACAKFVLLARMLPKLKAAGHRDSEPGALKRSTSRCLSIWGVSPSSRKYLRSSPAIMCVLTRA